VHDVREAAAAHAGGADYLLVGPVFPTATHPDRAPLGLAQLKEIVGVGLPVIAIGGGDARADSGAHGRGDDLRCGGDQGAVARGRSGGRRAADGPGAEKMNDTIDVTVNGEPRAVARGATLLALLESLALDPRAVVVEHNRTIVRRPRLAAVTVAPGDAIELVHFVGGG